MQSFRTNDCDLKKCSTKRRKRILFLERDIIFVTFLSNINLFIKHQKIMAVLQEGSQILTQTPKGILRNQSHRRGASMPISFCDQSTKKPVINQMINHEKALNFNKVGNDYFKNGYYKDAIDSYKQALKLFISSHGEEHKSVATTIGNIGNAYWKMGKLHEALARLENSLRILVIVSKKNNMLRDSTETLEICNTLHSIGIIHYLIGDSDYAISNFIRALNIYKVIHEENSTHAARTNDAMGSAYLQEGNILEAIKYFHDAVNVKQNLPDTNPLSLVMSMKNLANAAMINRDYEKALCVCEEIVTVQMSDGASSFFTGKDVGKIFHIVGSIHMQLKQHSVAKKFFKKAFQQYRTSGVTKDDPMMIELEKSMISDGTSQKLMARYVL